MTAERFAFAFDPTYLRLGRPFGVRPDTAWVQVDDGTLDAHFGRWRLTTELTNIVGTEITGPYALLKTAGPAHLGITDRGLTFATNGRRGLRMDFRTPVPGIDKWGLIKHPELTVTVEDCERLAQLLA